MSEPLYMAAHRAGARQSRDEIRRSARCPDEEVDECLQVLAELAEASGGGITDPAQTVGGYSDWEDNRILDLAAAVGAFLIVSADTDLTSMSPWRGRPIIEPPQFASLSTVPAGHADGAESCLLGPAGAMPGCTVPPALITQSSQVHQIPPPLPGSTRPET